MSEAQLFQRRWYALAMLCAANFMVILDGTIVFVAMPSMSADLGLDSGSGQWVMTKPEGLRYATFRLDDGVTFVHIVEIEGEHDPFSEVVAFKAFVDTLDDRLDGQVERPEGTIVGSYRFLTP